MDKIEEIEQKLNEIEREMKNTVNALEENLGGEIDDLRGALAELKESKKEGKWKPNYNEVYWFRDISNDGEIEQCKWYGEGMDIWRFNNIPIFKTENECKRYWHFMDTVKEKSYSFSKEEWEDSQMSKYNIYYYYTDKEWIVGTTWVAREMQTFYFKTAEDAQYIIDNFKDELMEYFV